MTAFETRNNQRTYDTDTHKVVPKDAVVLDLSQFGDKPVGLGLREAQESAAFRGFNTGALVVATIRQQIEKQTKPARIPEPGLWGVVEAHRRELDGSSETAKGVWVRVAESVCPWQHTSGQFTAEWSDLIDPVLIRPGIEDAHCEGHGGPGRWYCCQHPDAGWPCTETVEAQS